MDKIVELTKSQKDSDKLLIAKILDKIKLYFLCRKLLIFKIIKKE